MVIKPIKTNFVLTKNEKMKHLSLFKTHNFTITLKKSTDKFYIRPFGDVHRDAPSCDVERWKWFIKKSKEDPNADNTYYLGMGDYWDFASAKEGKTLKNSGLHETTLENIDYAAQRRSRLVAKEINHMKGRLIGLLGGNHTWVIDGKTLDEDLAERMGCAYLGYLSIIKLTVRFEDRGKSNNIYLFACQGLGGGRVLGSSIRKVEELFYIFPSADLYLMGHDHNRGAIPAPRLKPVEKKDGTLGLKQQRQFFIRSGSFQKSYTPDTGGFATGRLMRPADLGTVCIIGSFHRDQRDGLDNMILDLEVLI